VRAWILRLWSWGTGSAGEGGT